MMAVLQPLDRPRHVTLFVQGVTVTEVSVPCTHTSHAGSALRCTLSIMHAACVFLLCNKLLAACIAPCCPAMGTFATCSSSCPVTSRARSSGGTHLPRSGVARLQA